MTPRGRIAIVAGAVVALIVAFVVASGSGGNDKSSTQAATTPAGPAPTTPGTASTTATPAPAAPAAPVIEVVGAKPQGGIQRLKFHHGDTIRFTVHSDTADEIHVHGYDVHKDVAKGGRVTFTIPAKIEGRFVVELERHATQIAELEVDP
jgi:hypothetical protein